MKFKHDIEAQAGFKDKDGQLGSAGQILSSTGSQTDWIDQSTINAGNAEHVVIYAKNTSGASISKGTPVYITGTVGATDTVEIAPADASDSAKMPAVGLLDDTLANNAFGYVITGGFMDNITTDPIDGATPNSNDTVYVKAGGGLTLTKPTGASNLIQNVAKVGKVSGGNSGSLIVSSILRTNDVPNLTTGKIWVGSAANTIESATVHLDEANGRMGIGTASPDATLHLSGINQTGATNVFRISNDSGNTKFFVKSDSGNYNLQFKNAGNTTRVLLDSNGDSYLNGGNVGIGTTSPGVKLEVNGGNDNEIAKFLSTDDTAQISISDNDTDGFFGVKNGVAFISQTAGTPVSGIAVDSSGKVGIGTTNPGEELHISSVNPGVRLQDSDGTNTFGRVHFNVSTLQYFSRNDTSNGHHAWYGSNGTINTEFMRLRPTGEMRLNLYGSGTFTGTATQRLGVDSSGNVVEIPIGSGAVDGSGTANYVTKWTDADTIGNSIIYDDGTNVGIGTTSPTSRLEIKATSATHKLVSINRPASDTAALYLGNDSASPANGVISSNYSDLIFGRDQSSTLSEWMRIKRDGNVGIGTTSPTEKLDVNGNINIRSTASGIRGIKRNGDGYNLHLAGGSSLTGGSYVEVNGGSRGGVGNALNGEINFVSGGSYQSSQSAVVGNYNFKTQWNGGSATLMHIDSSTGNVGIGTTSPAGLLHVSSGTSGDAVVIIESDTDNNDENDNPQLQFKQDGGNTIAKLGLSGDAGTIFTNSLANTAYFGNDEAASVQLYTNTTARLTIESGGDVGIGTTNPSAKLEVEGLNAGLELDALILKNNSTTSGTATVLKFVNSTDSTSANNTSYIKSIRNAGNDNDLVFGTYANDRMTIDSLGNVGIGTTNPSEKLEVAGNARITGDVTLSNGNALRWTSDDVRIEGTTAGDNIKFYVANTEILQLAQSGTLATVTGNLRVTGAYYDSSNSAGTSGQVLSSTATGTDWVSLSEISGVDGTGTTNYVASTLR